MKAPRPYAKITITPKGEAALTGGHPWVYEGEVTAVDGRKLTFSAVMYDDAGEVGRATHERFIIQNDKFLAKAQGKKKGN